jgi:alkylation response protein AidB-like acyl-CoA dehydrogenase
VTIKVRITDKERDMAYAIVLEFAGVTQAQYDAVNEKLGIDMASGTGDFPTGLVSHAAGPLPSGWIVTEVWQSKAAQEAFMGGRLGAALGAVGVPAPVRVTESELVSYRAP